MSALIELFGRLGWEAATEGPGWAIIEEELGVGFEQLAAEVEPRLEAAGARISTLIDPLVGFVDSTFGAETDGDGAGQAIEMGQGVMQALAMVVESLTASGVAALLETLLDVIETDLGLTEARGRQFIGETVGRIVTRLQADYLDGANDSAAYSRYALGAVLQELGRLMDRDLGLPTFNKDTVLPILIGRLQDLGFDDKVGDVARNVSQVSQLLTPIAALGKFFPSAAFGPHSLGSAETPEQTCWYASWLRGETVKHVDPTSRSDPDSPLHGFYFDGISASAMEQWAYHSKWISCLAEAVLNAAFSRQYYVVPNIVNIVWNTTEGILAVWPEYIFPRWLKGIWWMFKLLPLGILGLVQDPHARSLHDAYGWLMILFDVARTQLFARWAWLAREALLSIMTLAIHDAESTPISAFYYPSSEVRRSHAGRGPNRNYVEGFAHLIGELHILLVPLIASQVDKEHYGIPNDDYAEEWGRIVGYFLLDLASVLFLTYGAGGLLTRPISGSWADGERINRLPLKERMLGRFFEGGDSPWHDVLFDVFNILVLPVSYLLDYGLYYYWLNDGRTDDGTFSERDGADLPGYPNPDSSPYRLPWAKGEAYQCVQGNMGIWSHNPLTDWSDVYAYDFSHDDEDEILAIRGGVVWLFEEDTPTGSDEDTNRVHILHDPVPAPAPTGGDLHDFDEQGNPRRTIAEYRHGRENGVTEAFAARGITIGTEQAGTLVADPLIVNAFTAQGVDLTALGSAQVPVTLNAAGNPTGPIVVQRGDAVMLADSTGRSAYHHLHLQVRPAELDASGNPLGAGRGSNVPYVIPFVFGDPDVKDDDGVPRVMRYYVSDNG